MHNNCSDTVSGVTDIKEAMKNGLVILGDQLFPITFYKDYQSSHVFMAEDMGLATHFKYHKHKIAFFFMSMRTYADQLTDKGFHVDYHKLSKSSFIELLEKFIKKHKLEKLIVPEIQDKFFEEEIQKFCKVRKIELEFLGSPMFLCDRQQFKIYLHYNQKPFMKTFYEAERKRQKILLLKDGKPEGGHWSFDVENRKKAPKVLTNKGLAKFTPGPHWKDVSKLVEVNFSDHPGSMENFWLPTDRAGALRSLDHFIKHHLTQYGDYQDAITARDPFLFHAMISPMMNNGLITPAEILERVLKAYREEKDIPLASVEGFVRQVMGWREFVRGIYQNFSDEQDTKNFFNHKGKLTKDWYEGTTGIPPVDDAIKKANQFGYCHHIERLMILSNIMLLSEIHPNEVHKWFMEMFVDSADWVMGPNVYGMGQFSDGGIFATKPYISGSNYIIKMSDYKKGEWSDVWDGLFWRFIEKNSAFFAKNYRMSMMVKTLEKMDPVKKKRLIKLAENFIHEKTK
jgi:deoxyribodipyrimidine photolyase-related protein